MGTMCNQRNLSPDFVPLAESSIAAIRVVVFAHKKHMPAVTYVEYGNEACGLGHVASDKGAVAISLVLYGTRIAFVNNHLAAHQEQVLRRISDVREVFEGLELGYHSSDTQFSSRALAI